MPTHQIAEAHHERRRHLRFPIHTELTYQISRQGPGEPMRGVGQVDNISSKGLAFHAEGPLRPGMRLNVSMAWPAMLDNQCMLRLVFEGTVLRAQGGLVVLTIERPDFRTAGKSLGGAREEIAHLANALEKLYPSKSVPYNEAWTA